MLSDIIDKNRKLNLRLAGRMHHLGTGIENAQTPVLKLVDDLYVRIANAATGEHLRELTIDPTATTNHSADHPDHHPTEDRTHESWVRPVRYLLRDHTARL